MIKVSVEIIDSVYVLLLSEEDSFEVVMRRDWFPEDIDPGDTVKLQFKYEDVIFTFLPQGMKRVKDRRAKTRPKERPTEVWNYMSFKKYHKTVERLPPNLTRIDSMGEHQAIVDSLSSDYGLMGTGGPFLKLLVPRDWLPEQIRKGDILNVFVQVEGYWVHHVHVRENLSNEREKAHLPQREEGLKHVSDRGRDNG